MNDHQGMFDPSSGPFLTAGTKEEAYRAGVRDGVREERERNNDYRRQLGVAVMAALRTVYDPARAEYRIHELALMAHRNDVLAWATASLGAPRGEK